MNRIGLPVTLAVLLVLEGCSSGPGPGLDASTSASDSSTGPADATRLPADGATALGDASEEMVDGGQPDLDASEKRPDGGQPGPDASQPIHGIFNVRDHGALGNGTADDTAAVGRTLIAAGAQGGIVYFPAGRYRLTGKLAVGAAVTLAGEGFEPPGAGAPGTLSGSWIIVDASFLNDAAIALVAAGAIVRDLGIWHEQPTPGAGWQPRAFGWAIDMTSADTLVRNVWLANPTLGIHGLGRATIENVQGEPITTGIKIEYAYDVVRLRRIRFNWTADGLPVWSSDPSVTSKLGVGIESLRDDNPEIYDVKVAGYSTGIHFGENATSGSQPGGATSKFSMMDTFVNNTGRCVTIDGANTTGKFTRFWGANCGATGVWITGVNSVVSAADIDLRQMTANAVRVEASGAFFLVNQLNIVDWDKAGAGFPAIEAADANATAKVGYFHSLTGTGTKQFGGVGQVSVDTDSANAAFDLRVPTPTEVVEDALTPFAAKVDVLQYGAQGNGTADDTPAIQKAIDDAASAGGGPVLVPGGDYLLKGALHVPSGVTLVGIGWDVTLGKGARFSVDATNTSDVVQLGDGASLKALAFRFDQGTLGPGWQPRSTFGFAIRVTGTNVSVRDVFLLNPTRGIAVSSSGTGPVLIDRVFGSPVSLGLHVDTNAALRVNDVHFWPFWHVCAGSPPNGCAAGTDDGYANSPKEGAGVAFQFDHSAHAELSNAFSISYAVGVLLGQNGADQVNTDLRVWNADQDIFGARGYSVSGPGTQATFANWSCQGDNGTTKAITGLWEQASATGAQIDGYNGDLRIFTANAIRSDASGSRIRFNLMRFEAWNGSGSGFPAAEGANGASVMAGPQEWENGK
jgi:hypothetical protein